MQFEAAVKRSAKKILYANLPDAEAEEKTPNCQVTLKSTENITPIRDLNVCSHQILIIRIVVVAHLVFCSRSFSFCRRNMFRNLSALRV